MGSWTLPWVHGVYYIIYLINYIGNYKNIPKYRVF